MVYRDADISANAVSLMRKAGVGHDPVCTPIEHGGNNRAWTIESKGNTYFLKEYFVSDMFHRDRFSSEIAFTLHAKRNGVEVVPDLISADKRVESALFSYIEGRRPTPAEINKTLLGQVLFFLRDINDNNQRVEAQSLPFAAEACLAESDHFHAVKWRLDRLNRIELKDKIDGEALGFIRNQLIPESRKIISMIEENAEDRSAATLPWIMLSPSDLGFHNALLSSRNQLSFFDFEYAGWDGPVKLICDFFCQPEIPVSLDWVEWFSSQLNSVIPDKWGEEQMLHRHVRKFLPLYRLKWCCIMLNDFLDGEKLRKHYASFGKDNRETQLEKAVNYLKDFDYGIY